MISTLNCLANAAFEIAIDEEVDVSVRRIAEYIGLALDELNDFLSARHAQEVE